MSNVAYHDDTYLNLVKHVLDNGVIKHNRTGVDTKSVFGYHMRFNLRDGSIPLLTTKRMHTKSVIREILWYLRGGDNIKYLNEHGVTIWDEWAREDGALGPVYGVQWRSWSGPAKYDDATGLYSPGENIDQVAKVIDLLRNKPDDRRLIVNAWNVGELDAMALPPCHYAFQFYSRPIPTDEHGRTRELSIMLNQRSADVGLGVPFNIVQYSILLRMFCEVVNMAPGELIWNGGDVHIYTNHIEPLTEQLSRTPFSSPHLTFKRKIDDIDAFEYDDFIITNYEFHPSIKMDVAV